MRDEALGSLRSPGRDGHALRAGLDERACHRLGGAARADEEHVRSAPVQHGADGEAVGARPMDLAVLDHERVHGGRAAGHVVDDVAVLEHGRLVRDGDVRSGEAQRHEATHRFADPGRLDRERHVGPVEPDRRERGVLHARRERVRDRIPDDADEAGRPAQHRLSRSRNSRNSASLSVKKWLLQSALRTKNR